MAPFVLSRGNIFLILQQNGPSNITIIVQTAFSVKLFLFFLSYFIWINFKCKRILDATVFLLYIRCDFHVQQKYQMFSAADLHLQ